MNQTPKMPRPNARTPALHKGVNPCCAAAMFVMAFAFTSVSFPAYADTTPMSEVLCQVLDILQGGAGKAMGTLGIAVIGIAACMGKASWGMAMTVGVGIGVMLGADQIVKLLGLGLPDCG